MSYHAHRAALSSDDIALHEHSMCRNINKPQVFRIIGSIEFGQLAPSLSSYKDPFAVGTIEDLPLRTGGGAPVGIPLIKHVVYVKVPLSMFEQVVGASFDVQIGSSHSVLFQKAHMEPSSRFDDRPNLFKQV